MRRVSLYAIPVLAATILNWPTALRAQETKTARGTVTAVAADAVTIKVKDMDMKFNVDDKTNVIATGAGTKAAAAKSAGMSGPKLTDVVKMGQAVEITYHDMGGTYHAASIRAIASAGEGSVSTPAKTSNGTVKSVAADSITVTGSDGQDMTFAIDSSTKVVGVGIGTKAAPTGGKAAITDLLTSGDKVSVTYHDMGGSMHAASIRRTSKATAK